MAERRRRFWFDPRFAIGIGLVLVSVIGVIGLVSSADSSVPVFAARVTLEPGHRVTADDLVVERMRSGAADRLYLAAPTIPAGGLVITRAVVAGELVPVSALGRATGVDLASVVLPVGARLPASVVASATVEVWSAKALQGGAFGAPTVVVSSATVARVVEQTGIMVDDSGTSVELLVPRADVARVLEAEANGAALSLVPVGIALGG